MASIQLNSFFGCYKLETGGLFISRLYIVIYSLLLFLTAVPILIFTVFATVWCSSISLEIINQIEAHVPFSCGLVAGLSFLFLVIVVLVIVGFIFIALTCIKGVKTRDDTKIILMMILVGLAAVSLLSSFFTLSFGGIVGGMFGVLWSYFFLVLFSLYTLFRDERDQGVNIKMDNIATA